MGGPVANGFCKAHGGETWFEWMGMPGHCRTMSQICVSGNNTTNPPVVMWASGAGHRGAG